MSLDVRYFNFSHNLAESGWDRSSFARKWWHAYARDPYWVPPYYPIFRRELEPGLNPHLRRMSPRFIYSTALPRSSTVRRSPDAFQVNDGLAGGFSSDQTVAVGLVLCDPRRKDRAAHLAMFRCINDPESLERFLDFVADHLSEAGYQRLIGPLGLSTYLCSGLLEDHWDHVPPPYTAYNPPYMPELLRLNFEPAGAGRLYTIDIPEDPISQPAAPARLMPFETDRLSGDLLPLLAGAGPGWPGFPQADAEEAAFLLRWIGYAPCHAWLATVDGQAAGFVLLQPDLSPWLKMANGGRNLIWRIWLHRSMRKPASQGRLLFASVLPTWRTQGVGRQLFQQALVVAQDQGWKRLIIGPLPEESKSIRAFLEGQGALPGQTYRLYQMDMR